MPPLWPIRLAPRAAPNCIPVVRATLVAFLALAACNQESDLTAAHPVLRLQSADIQKQRPTFVREQEDAFAQLAREVPSSAGFYFDNAGRVVVWISDAKDAAPAETALRNLAGRRAITLRPGSSEVPEVAVRVGLFNFQQLAAWRDSIEEFADDNLDAGIASLDLDEKNNRIGVGVVAGTSEQFLLDRLKQLGVDPRAVDFQVVQRMKFDAARSLMAASSRLRPVSRSGARLTLADIRSTQPTMIGGLDIGLSYNGGGGANCTIGFVVQHIQSGVTKQGFTTASHCTEETFGADVSTLVYQDTANAPSIGQEDHDPNGYRCGLEQCRGSDLAFIRTNTGVSLAMGQVVKWAGAPYDSYTYDPSDNWVVTAAGTQGVYVGSSNDWVGYHSGMHMGAVVTKTCQDLFPLVVGPERLTCGMEDSIPASQGGDSGGPVFMELGRGNEVQAVGTVSGHPDSYHMIWSNITRAGNDFSAEGATLVVDPTSVTAPTASQSIDASGYPVVSWSAVSGALYYNIFHTYTDANCSVTNAGNEYAYSTTSTTFSEAISVTGMGVGFNCPYEEYWVNAVTATGYSAQSNHVYFY